jgi:hypothetical protein
MTTQYFETTLHMARCSVSDEFFERSAGLIFEKEQGRVRIEARCWTDGDLSLYRRADESLSTPNAFSVGSPQCDSIALGERVTSELAAEHEPAGNPPAGGTFPSGLPTSAGSQALPQKLIVVDLDTTKLVDFILVCA